MIKKLARKLYKKSCYKQLPKKRISELIFEAIQLPEQPARIHNFILDIFTEIVDASGSKAVLLYHYRDDGKKWLVYPKLGEYAIPVNAQLEFLADEKGIEYLSDKNPLIAKIKEALSLNGRLNEALLFRFTKETDYLYLFEKTDSVAEQYDLFMVFIKMLHKNVQLQLQNIRQASKNKLLQKSLAQSDKKLHSTEKSLRKRIYEINNLLEISNELYSNLDLEQMINAALLIIIGQIGSEKAFVVLNEPMRGGFFKYYSKGFGSETSPLTVELDEPIVSFLLRQQQPVLVEELKKHQELSPFIQSMEEDDILLLAPLIYSERLEGIIGCGEKIFGGEWGASDIQMFNILVNIISVSLGNAQMYEQVKKMSFTDAMTNLNNYRYFENRLREEIKRAQRQNSKVSMIMMDIDHFKNYNDSLGHQAGDEALRKVALVLKNTAREDDIVTRYGGEEFSVILPGTEKEVVAILAERLRNTIEADKFFREEVQPEGRLTISLGGATFPDDAENYEQLIEKADKALYKSKENGRNRFTIYDKSMEM